MPAAPERFGRYEVVRSLGGGAMGEIYLARDAALGRDVAIKVMRPAPGVAAELFRARFDAEARALAALRHPAVVAIYDLGWDGDTPYLVMELVPGGSLRDRIAAGPLSAADVRALGIQIGGALAAAHAVGILHRDVKPANVLGGPPRVTDPPGAAASAAPGEWKLADFGIAHVPGSELTMTGQFLGTPAYAAPEALAEGAHTPAADVWGLGATLYAAITGAAPYGGAFGAAASTTYTPAGARGRDVPPALAAAIDAALDRDPARRPTMIALCAQLADERVRAPAPVAPSARPAWLWPAIGGAALLAIGLVAVLASGGNGGGGRDATSIGARRDVEPAPAAPADPGAMVTVRGDGSIAIDRAQLAAPRSDDANHQLDDAIHKAEDGHLDPAIDKLDELLARSPDDQPAEILRASLAQLRDQGYGEPHGKKKHKHGDD